MQPEIVNQLAAGMRRLPEFAVHMRDIGLASYWRKYGWPAFCRPLDEEDFECD